MMTREFKGSCYENVNTLDKKIQEFCNLFSKNNKKENEKSAVIIQRI